jgi:hypothetical protein
MSFDDDMLIAAVHRAASQQKASMRTGKVVSVNAAAGTIVVEVSGVALRDIPYDAGLSPIPGKVVWLIDQGPWIAAIAAPAKTGQGGGSGGGGGGGGVTDHGALTGLGDDDHTQYLTAARGDIRYPFKSQVPTNIGQLVNVADGADTAPVGKVLGTTAAGTWEPVDPPAGGGGANTLDGLLDVTAPSSTPPGKMLATTATGAWEPVDVPGRRFEHWSDLVASGYLTWSSLTA